MKTIALYSIKGGVGKTAAAANLAYMAANEGISTLLFDLDPQGASTYYFRIKASKNLNKKILFKSKKRIDRYIKGTDFENLDLLPSHISYRNLDLALDSLKKPKGRLRQMFGEYKKEYKLVIVDCPPNITLVSENIFTAADYIVVPFVPTTLSFATYEKLMRFFENKRLDRSKIIAFFSMVEKRKKLHQDMIIKMSAKKKRFLKSQIPYSSVVERMGVHREPVLCFEPNALASQSYMDLWQEIKKKIQL